MSFREYLGAKSVLLCLTGFGGLYLAMVFYFCGLSGSLVGILLGSGLLLAAAGFVVTDRYEEKGWVALAARQGEC